MHLVLAIKIIVLKEIVQERNLASHSVFLPISPLFLLSLSQHPPKGKHPIKTPTYIHTRKR
jgi:hypothetical protein